MIISSALIYLKFGEGKKSSLSALSRTSILFADLLAPDLSPLDNSVGGRLESAGDP